MAITLADGYILNIINSNANQNNEKFFQDGYTKGLTDGADRGFQIRDPSYTEMKSFIQTDKTNQNPYVEGSYVCWQYSSDVINNAFNAGYRCGFVYIALADSAHSIVCFNTTDKGLVFIEPQDDSEKTLTVGTPYFDRSLYEVDYNDTITSFTIAW